MLYTDIGKDVPSNPKMVVELHPFLMKHNSGYDRLVGIWIQQLCLRLTEIIGSK